MYECRIPKILYIILISFAALCSCVYYNTFYNAQKAFYEARKSQIKRAEKATSDSLERVSDAEKKDFDRAIEKASKVLEVYHNKKKWQDDAIFLIGESYFYQDEFAKAIRKFNELLNFYPQSPFIPEARFLLAKSYLGSGDFDRAETAFQEFLKDYPKRPESAEIALLIGEISFGRGGRLKAVEQLQEALSAASGEKASRLHYRIAAMYYEIEKYREAFEEYQKIETKYLIYNEEFKVQLQKARCLKQLRQLQEALKILQKMQKDNRNYSRIDEIYMEQGKCYEQMGEHKKALEIYIKITESTESGGGSSQAGAANFRIGDIYQNEYGDLIKAKEYYAKASSAQDPEISSEAQQRTKSIEKLEELRKLVSDTLSDSTKQKREGVVSGMSEYMMGELFWFQLGLADSALKWFQAAADDSLADSLYGQRAAYAIAWIYRDAKHDTVKSDSVFKYILTRYPQSEQAAGAQKALGMPVTVKTRLDSAHDAYLDAEAKFWQDKKIDAAIAYFDSIAGRFPETPYAPKAAYTIAWIYNEILNDSANAATRYKLVYDKWKDTEYAKSAKRKLTATIEAAGEQSQSAGKNATTESKPQQADKKETDKKEDGDKRLIEKKDSSDTK